MKMDRLFLLRGCPECARVRAALDWDAVQDDDFLGTSGQGLMVFSAASDAAGAELLDRFDLAGRKFPLVITFEDTVVEKTANVLARIGREGMASE